MYAREISTRLKPSMLNDFNKTFEQEILPMLRKQKGFKDEITFSAPASNEVVAISLWNTKEDAEAYNTAGYPEALKLLSKTIEGTPTLRNFEVLHSTLHKVSPISATVAA
jgi:heme-degrading monooxygenase HmoA